jgi:hypothetical protein
MGDSEKAFCSRERKARGGFELTAFSAWQNRSLAFIEAPAVIAVAPQSTAKA